jgi:hypothetical protein
MPHIGRLHSDYSTLLSLLSRRKLGSGMPLFVLLLVSSAAVPAEPKTIFESLSGHPKPANEGHLKTGQR